VVHRPGRRGHHDLVQGAAPERLPPGHDVQADAEGDRGDQ
jgi:hypothetical protein